eukprot:1107760-Rhodomonas_salina.2
MPGTDVGYCTTRWQWQAFSSGDLHTFQKRFGLQQEDVTRVIGKGKSWYGLTPVSRNHEISCISTPPNSDILFAFAAVGTDLARDPVCWYAPGTRPSRFSVPTYHTVQPSDGTKLAKDHTAGGGTWKETWTWST